MMVLKVKIKPTTQQHQMMKQWIGTSQLMFNRALDLVRKGEKVSKKLRTKLVTKKSVKEGGGMAQEDTKLCEARRGHSIDKCIQNKLCKEEDNK